MIYTSLYSSTLVSQPARMLFSSLHSNEHSLQFQTSFSISSLYSFCTSSLWDLQDLVEVGVCSIWRFQSGLQVKDLCDIRKLRSTIRSRIEKDELMVEWEQSNLMIRDAACSLSWFQSFFLFRYLPRDHPCPNLMLELSWSSSGGLRFLEARTDSISFRRDEAFVERWVGRRKTLFRLISSSSLVHNNTRHLWRQRWYNNRSKKSTWQWYRKPRKSNLEGDGDWRDR